MCFTRLPLKAGYGISPLQCYICFNRLTLVERVIELDIFQNQSLYENPISAIQRQKKKKRKLLKTGFLPYVIHTFYAWQTDEHLIAIKPYTTINRQHSLLCFLIPPESTFNVQCKHFFQSFKQNNKILFQYFYFTISHLNECYLFFLLFIKFTRSF